MNNTFQIVSRLLMVNQLRSSGDVRKAIDLAITIYDDFGSLDEICELISDLYFALSINSRNENGENYQKAIQWLKIPIKKDESKSILHSKLGDLYWIGLLDYQSATEEYHRAIELDSNNLKAYIGIAALYGSPDSNVSVEEAIKCLKTMCELEPDNPVNYVRLGDLLYEYGSKTEAFIAWLHALSCSKPLEDGYITSIYNHLK